MNLSNLFGATQSVLVVLAGLIALAEDSHTSGPAKKAAVLSALDGALDHIPLSGLPGDVVKVAAKALAPTAIDLLVAKANQAGLLPAADPSSTVP